MKKIIILTLTVIAMYSCDISLIKPIYHLKIDCWDGNENFGTNLYSIYFTNNDGLTYTSINDGADLPYIWPLHSGDTTMLIKMAKRFKKYNDCIAYNDSVQRLYDSLNPPKKNTILSKTIDTVKCCSAKQIY